jgi:integrase
MLVTLAFSGLRIGEARGLAWSSIHGGYIEVRRAADRFNNIGPVKTVAAMRRVPIGSYLVNTLGAWMADCPDSPLNLVFPSKTGTLLTYSNIVNRGFYWLQLMLGMVDGTGRPRYTPHTLRHFAVSLWIDQGADPKQVSEWVGHESVSFTLDVYGHLFKARAEDRSFSEAAERAVSANATRMQHERRSGLKRAFASVAYFRAQSAL